MSETAFAVGVTTKFKAYTDLQGMEPMFQPGEEITITEVKDDGSFVIASPDGTKSDNVFPEELEAPAAKTRTRAAAKPAAAQTATEAPAPAAAKGKGKGKAAAAAPAEAPAAAAPAPALKGGAGKKGAAKTGNLAAAATKGAEKAAAKAETKPAKAPKVAEPKQAAEPEKVTIVNTDAVEAVLKDQDALTAAKVLIQQTEENFFTLGGVLAHVYYEGAFKTAGFENFQSYVEAELGVAYRRAMQLIDIYNKFTPLGIDEKRLTEIGWTKARELTKVVTKENVDEVMQYAAANTRDDIIEYVKTQNVRAETGTGNAQPTERVQRSSFKFSLFADQAQTVQASLDRAKELANTDDLSAAFHYICQEWAQLTEAVPTTLEEDLARISAKHGVEINLGGDEEAAEEQAEAA